MYWRFIALDILPLPGSSAADRRNAKVAKVPRLRMAIGKPSEMTGFVVVPRRWVVERTFPGSGATGSSPRISRTLLNPFATFVTVASIELALRRRARA
jgi:hypothetical protein